MEWNAKIQFLQLDILALDITTHACDLAYLPVEKWRMLEQDGTRGLSFIPQICHAVGECNC